MKILVMKSLPEGKELVNDLNDIGINSWHASLFDFYPSISLKNLSNKINELYKSDIILIFSKKAIYYTDLYLKNNNLTWPSYPRYYTIGKSTAIFLYQHIKKKIFFSKKKENSESLLNLLNKNKLKNFKIVLLQGENGRKLIENYFIKKKLIFVL